MAKAYQERLATRTRVFSVVYGIVWLIDAAFKWQPAFTANFTSYVKSTMQGQPGAIMPWFMFWIKFINIDPKVIAILIASVETLIALSLLLGIARKPVYIIGALVSIGIWSVAEGFGGPYGSGATDIGAAIMYAFVFAALWGLEQFSAPTSRWTLDQVIAERWPAWRMVGMWHSPSHKPQ